MSTVIAKNVQVGTSGTSTDNFTIFQPATPDGTLRIGNGNTGITTSQVALTSAGNVGIGTNAPVSKLHIESTSAEALQIGYSSTKRGRIGATSAGDLQVYAYETGVGYRNILLATDAGSAAGNVGIGTSSPGYKLDVSATSFIAASVSTSNSGAGNIRIADASTTSASAPYIGSVGDNLTFGRIGTAEYARITSTGLFQFNSGYGSVATAYGCRAWVNFNGTGTVAIRASGNVTSITDNGTADYTVNFTTAMPDANYSCCCTAFSGNGRTAGTAARTGITTSSARVIFADGGTGILSADTDNFNVSIFR